jgi:Zn-dependent M28 family amino/carboxypeptidase
VRRSALVLAALLLAPSCKGSSQSGPGFDGAQALRWVEHQVRAGPRVPNSAAHRAIGDWLLAELRSRADTVEVQAWVHVTRNGDTLSLRNFIARFRPGDQSRILYVSHWDSRPTSDQEEDAALRALPTPGANDGGSSTALLLGVADLLKRTPPAVGVDLLFTDAEDWGDFSTPDALIGSRYFAANLPPGYRPLFAVVWDMVGGRNARFEQEGHSLDGAPEVVERVWRTAGEIGLGRMFRARRAGPITDDHVPLLEAGIRAINVITVLESYPAWHTLRDTPDQLSAETLSSVGRLAMALIPR